VPAISLTVSLAGIDEVRVFLAFDGEGADTSMPFSLCRITSYLDGHDWPRA